MRRVVGKTWSLVLVLIGVVLLLGISGPGIVTQSSEQHENLLVNSDFENGLYAWNQTRDGVSYRASTLSHSGNRSAEGIETYKYNLGRLYQDLTGNLIPEEQYKIGGWIKTQNVKGQVVIALDYVKRDGWCPLEGYVKEIGYVTGTTKWQYFESNWFVLPQMPSNCSMLWFLFDFNNGEGTAWFDDVFLVAQSTREDGISRAMKCDVTGNYYQLVRKDLTWEEAKAYAEGLEPIEETGGLLYFPHLATITSPRENSWIIENLLVPTGTDDVYPWLGGYQAEGYDNPAEEWRWITGEDWAWVNWGNDQPDDEFGQWNECYLKMFPQVRNYRWNDESIDGKSKWWVNYALIEYGREGLKPAFPEPTPAEYKPKIYIHKEEKWKLEGVYYYGPLYGYDDYAGENCYCIEYWFKFNGDGDKAGDDWEPVYVFIDSTGEVIYCASPFHYRWDSKDTEADDFDGHHVKVYFAENWHTPIVDYEDSWMKVLLFGYIEEPSKYFEETGYLDSLEQLTYKKYPHDIEQPFSPERGDWTREDWEAVPLGFKMWKTDPGGFNFAIEIKGVSLENAKQYPELYAIQAAKWIVDNYFGLLSQAETFEGLLQQFKVPIPPMAAWTRKGIESGITLHIKQLIVNNIDNFAQQMYIYAMAPPWPAKWWVAGI
ncbi:carbohydrate binding domain-containing protein [Candidatus Bipolaricaulota bacterium]|nr:carbohydrate binding domain-containing protein [Candidatus Bipolaricaulota bacterium]